MIRVGIAGAILATVGATTAIAQEAGPGLRDRSIAYVITNEAWTVNTTADAKQECPKGINDGPREQYAVQFPDDGKLRTVMETQLLREAEVWFPDLTPDPFPFSEAVSKVVRGVNLDGKVGEADFTSPDGEVGIDNQLYRVIGCVDQFRPGNGLYDALRNYMRQQTYTRMVIELTDVDSLENDDNVTVNVYRGNDALMTDSSGNEYLPYGSMRVNGRWGKEFQKQFRGKITNGVLTSGPADVHLPMNYFFSDFQKLWFRDAQFQLRVLPDKAEGILAGYIDIEAFHRSMIGWVGTHSISYGRYAAPSVYKALYRLADGFPDKLTGRNTAISGAMDLTFRQVFIKHENPRVASSGPANSATGSGRRAAE